MTQITVLYLTANPTEVPRLGLDREIREITEKIRLSEHRSVLTVVPGWAVRPEDLLQYLNLYKPTIVHFSGHGGTSGELILVDRQGNAKPIAPDALAALFLALKDSIRVVLLNACYSASQAAAIAEVVDCAIGVGREIGDDAAIEFAASFYSAIGFGRSIQEAFDIGVALLKLEGVSRDQYPQLHVKPGVDASSIVLAQSGQGQEAGQTDTAPPAEGSLGDQLERQRPAQPTGPSGQPTHVLADFRLTQLLQENPRSAIFRAVRSADGETVLIKKIKDKAHYRPALIREIAQLYADNPSHVHVALPQAILEEADCFYEVLEFLEGWTFGEIVGRNRSGICGSLLEEWARDLLEVLFPLHRNGFAHRDISPYNLLLTRDNLQLVLLDFSNALPVFSSLEASPFFTPGFSAPELASTPCTYAGDIYSVGAVLFFLNACRIPPTAEERVYKGREIALQNVTYRKLENAIHRMLSLPPEDRFEDAVEAFGSLQRTGSTELMSMRVLGEFHLPDGTKLVMSRSRWKRVPASEQIEELKFDPDALYRLRGR